MGTRSWGWAVTSAAGELRKRLAVGRCRPAGGDHGAVGHRRGRRGPRTEGTTRLRGAVRKSSELAEELDANATWHATGGRHRHLPIRPDRVLLADATDA
jgi:hypothetical protein